MQPATMMIWTTRIIHLRPSLSVGYDPMPAPIMAKTFFRAEVDNKVSVVSRNGGHARMALLTAPEGYVLGIDDIFAALLKISKLADEAGKGNDAAGHLHLVAIREGTDGSQDADK